MATEEDFRKMQVEIALLKKQLDSKTNANPYECIATTSVGGLPESKHLDGKNYSDWKFWMKNFLIDSGLWRCIEYPAGTTVDKDLNKTLAKINLSIKSNVMCETKKTSTAQELIWLKGLQNEIIGTTTRKCVTLFCDNQGMMKFAENPIVSQRAKHIDIKHHFIREKIKEKDFKLQYVCSKENVADFLTKSLYKQNFENCVRGVGLFIEEKEDV